MSEGLAALAIQVAVGVLTLSISIQLQPEHFRRAVEGGRPLVAGLAVQLAVVPCIVLALALSGLVRDPVLLTALCLVSLTPSGPTSNYLTHVARGDVALALLLTVIGTLLSAAVMPLALPSLLQATTGQGIQVVTPLAVFQSLLVMVVAPLLAGLWLQRRHHALAERIRPALGKLAGILFVVLLLGAVASQWKLLATAATGAALPLLGTNAAALAIGGLLAAACGLAAAQRTTLALKTGVQNVSIALGIAIGVLGRLDVAAIAGLYGLTQLLVATAYALAKKRSSSTAGAGSPQAASEPS